MCEQILTIDKFFISAFLALPTLSLLQLILNYGLANGRRAHVNSIQSCYCPGDEQRR
jgi:hypothetical protein